MKSLLLLSNSRDAEGRYLLHAREAIADHLSGVNRALFVPFAGVSIGADDYAGRVREALAPIGVTIDLLTEDNAAAAVRSADALLVGGGNTFRLLQRLQDLELVELIRKRAADGMPYVGWSAGSVIACPTMQTTNDMPVVQPRSFAALGLVPFQINAHFTDAHPPGFQGETRRERIAEYLELNQEAMVVGLPEGDWIHVSGTVARLRGPHSAMLFRHARDPLVLSDGDTIADGM